MRYFPVNQRLQPIEGNKYCSKHVLEKKVNITIFLHNGCLNSDNFHLSVTSPTSVL